MADDSSPQIGKDLVTLAQATRRLAESRLEHQDWSGLPIPVPGLDLVLEPRYKHKAMSDFRWKECYDEHGVRHAIDQAPAPKQSEFKVVNSWWSARYQAIIYVVHDGCGRASVRFSLGNRLGIMLQTLDAAAVWPVEAEEKAQKKLASLIPTDAFELYFLTGQFFEFSSRSGLTYLFRRGRPTIAMRQGEEFDYALCALCLHPIGYYADTWAGVMCPTDEVIAHLLMMRGSEEKFWANANQHALDRPGAGI